MGQGESKDDLLRGPFFASRRIVLPFNKLQEVLLKSAGRPRASAVSYLPRYRLTGEKGSIEPEPIQYEVYGDPRNHKPFLNPETLQHFLPFVCDPTLPKLLEVCPHWFVTIHKFILDVWTKPITDSFAKTYQGILELECFDFAIQPLYIEDFGIRADLLIFAKVLPSCKGKCLEIANSSSLLQPSPRPSEDSPQPPFARPLADRRLRTPFRVEVKAYGTTRNLWFRKDNTRFHGDEILVVGGPFVPEVCVYDRLEIPINLCNALGVLDPSSLVWHPPKFITAKDNPPRSFGQKCPLELPNTLWFDFDTFCTRATDPLPTFDVFGPQWQLKDSKYSGESLVVSRSTYSAHTGGKVERAITLLGLHITVLDKNAPIVVPLKRLGMEHDRFANQQIRKGDRIRLYVVQGGPEPP